MKVNICFTIIKIYKYDVNFVICACTTTHVSLLCYNLKCFYWVLREIYVKNRNK